MRITKQRRGRGPVKRLDLSEMRSLFADRRVWSALGTVYKPDDAEHWHLEPGPDGSGFDIIVEVETQPGQVTMSARLAAGMWDVPAVGEEVAILIPDGMIDFQPVIVARLSSGTVPSVQGPAPNRIVIARGEVLIHDGAGGAGALALVTELQNLRDWVNAQFSASNGHVHAVAGAATTTMVTVATPAASPPTPSIPPNSIGTTVLKAK